MKGTNMEALGCRVDALETVVRELQAAKVHVERSRNVWRLSCAVIAMISAVVLFPWSGIAQDTASNTEASLKKRLVKLEKVVAALQTDLTGEVSARTKNDASTLASAKTYADTKTTATLNAAKAYADQEVSDEAGSRTAADASLQAQVNPLAFVLAPFSRIGSEVVISGANLHVVNGTDGTETANGLGNLIVGYNELRGDGTDSRTGSHSIIVGMGNNFSSYGGLVVGTDNAISGKWASVCAGFGNTASGDWSSVTGGSENVASGRHSSVSGGSQNIASALWATVAGGGGNKATGDKGTVNGGQFNEAKGIHSTVGGGQNRIAQGLFDWIAGILFQDL